MKQNLSNSLYWTTLLLFGLTFSHNALADPPPEINIQGTLQNASGDPLAGTYDFRVRFYDSEVGGSKIGDVLGSMTPSTAGRFSIEFVPPQVVLDATETWYELAVDMSGDGIDPADIFPNRVRVNSVPFALDSQRLGGVPANRYPTVVLMNNELADKADKLHNHDKAYWGTAGNIATTAGVNFLGTTDNEPLEIVVDSTRALRIEPRLESPNIIGGHGDNSVRATARGATIGGGGEAGESNIVTSSFSTIGGGSGNIVGNYSTVGGGRLNSADGTSVVGGGYLNSATGINSTVSGGRSNDATGWRSAVGGGQSNIASATGSTVSGGHSNSATDEYSTVAGGQSNKALGLATTVSGGRSNQANSDYGTVGGGFVNRAKDMYSTVSGGKSNSASGEFSTVGGGTDNQALERWTTVSGGRYNSAIGHDSAVCGGASNSTTGEFSVVGGGDGNGTIGSFSTVPGGRYNNAIGWYSLAGGHKAQAEHDGSFVWADSQNTEIASSAEDEVTFRCLGGVRFLSGSAGTGQTVEWAPGSSSWTFSSDRNLKEDFSTIDSGQVLEKVRNLPVNEWNFKGYDLRHIGPTAQDFHRAFGLGGSETRIDGGDLHGVALAAIQGLQKNLEKKDEKIESLEMRIASLEAIIESIQKEGQ